MRLKDHTGLRYGRLVVLSKHQPGAGRSAWLCRCDCGTEKVIGGGNLKSCKSCGCLARERAAAMGANPDYIAMRRNARRTHGHRSSGGKTVEYSTWLAIKRRCYDAGHKDYPNWGGRGIRVCERWNASFEDFLSDMGPRPAGRYSIDRIDPNGDYRPDNCHWTPAAMQAAEHKRGLLEIQYNGVTYPSLTAACRAAGIPKTRAHYRLRAGMPMDQVLSSEKFSRWSK